ncbi:MAG TPA: metallophosphoesterase family protein [Actinomycetota bacterium]|nr:metallophosphoesterase family protein [Actinomycetota bacterium]
MRIGVISDTHIPSRASGIPAEALERFAGVELILHAGDISVARALDELRAVAPVQAVAGNVEDPFIASTLPPELRVAVGGVEIGMVHNSGAAEGRRARLQRRFPGCRVVVFGHSHMPVVEDRAGLLLLNPGSACDPRRAPAPTVAILTIAGGEPSAELVALSARRSR